jgi:hypothetical protein
MEKISGRPNRVRGKFNLGFFDAYGFHSKITPKLPCDLAEQLTVTYRLRHEMSM